MFSFVILHYGNIEDTIDCIESINKIKTNKDISIIVVDNNSLTNIEKQKLKKFTEDIILLDENLGFARANNIGCKYAKNKYNPDFIAVINNDTLILEDKFINQIYDIYEKTNFDFFGPQIITDDGDSVNPFPVYDSIEKIDSAIKKSKKLIKIYSNRLLRSLLQFYIYIKHFIKKPSHLKNGDKSLYNIALHGCFLVFSKKYIFAYEDIFDDCTFLYHEEEFLNFRRMKDNLISYYDPSVLIFHKEGSSLNSKFNNKKYEKLIFQNQEILKSLNLLKEKFNKE